MKTNNSVFKKYAMLLWKQCHIKMMTGNLYQHEMRYFEGY